MSVVETRDEIEWRMSAEVVEKVKEDMSTQLLDEQSTNNDLSSHSSIARMFVNCVDTLHDEFDLTATLRSLQTATQQLLPGCEVSVAMAGDTEKLRIAIASSENKRKFDEFQLSHGQGPVVEAFRIIRPVVGRSKESAYLNWKSVVELGNSLGFHDNHAIPLARRNEIVGVLSISQTSKFEIDPWRIGLVRALADSTAVGILNQQAFTKSTELGQQLQGALTSRVLIEQSKGIVAGLCGISVDQAFAVLRGYARGNKQKLNAVALAVVERRIDPKQLCREFALSVQTPKHDQRPKSVNTRPLS